HDRRIGCPLPLGGWLRNVYDDPPVLIPHGPHSPRPALRRMHHESLCNVWRSIIRIVFAAKADGPLGLPELLVADDGRNATVEHRHQLSAHPCGYGAIVVGLPTLALDDFR